MFDWQQYIVLFGLGYLPQFEPEACLLTLHQNQRPLELPFCQQRPLSRLWHWQPPKKLNLKLAISNLKLAIKIVAYETLMELIIFFHL